MSANTPLESNQSFETTDAFGWSGFATKLEAFLLTETEFVEGSLVASLSAPFGSGKTTFIRMWKDHLDTRRESDANVSRCILLNAWEDDYCGDPLLSLVDAIENEFSERTADKKTADHLDSVKEATKDLGWFIVGMANSAASHWTGLDAAAAGELAETKKASRGKEQPIIDVLSLFQGRKAALSRLKCALRSLFEEDKAPVFILVDELDRCRPDFAVQYLETIKHIFDVEGLAFVLAVDLHQLENSARALFGEGLNFPEYYRKFAHRNIRLPSPDAEGIRTLVTRYTDRYLGDPNPESMGRKSLLDFRNTRNALTELPHNFRLTPRKIQEGFRILGHMTSVQEKKGDLYFHIANAVIFLTFLNLWKSELFEEILSGEVSLDRLLEIISTMPTSKNQDWWAFVLAMSLGHDGERVMLEDQHVAFVKYGFFPKDSTVEQFQQRYRGFTSGGYGGSSSLSELAKKIQEIERFGQ